MEGSTALLMRWLGLFALGLAVMSASVLMAVCGSGGSASRSAGTGSFVPALDEGWPWVSVNLGAARPAAWSALLSALAPSRIASGQGAAADATRGLPLVVDGAGHSVVSEDQSVLGCTSPFVGEVVWATQ